VAHITWVHCRTCYAHEYSTVDPHSRVMEMSSVNLTFCNFVSMREVMSYRPHPQDPANKTLLKQETVVEVQGVPLTSYMESLIVGTVAGNAGKGRRAMEWILDKVQGEGMRTLASTLDGLSADVMRWKSEVEDSAAVAAARTTIDELQRDVARTLAHAPILVQAAESSASVAVNSRKEQKERSDL